MERKHVLFFVPFGSYRVHHQLDAIVATALRLRGHDVTMLGCDGLFRTCDVLAWSGGDAARHCAECAASGQSFMRHFGLELTQLRGFVSQEDVVAASAWADSVDPNTYRAACFHGLPIGSWVTSSVYSYFRISEDKLSDPAVQRVHKQFLINGVVTARAVSRCIDAAQPSGACVFNGRMAPYRIALELLTARNIPVVVHERGHIDDSFMLYKDRSILSTEPVYQCADAWKDVPLTAGEARLVKDYYHAREAGKGTNYIPFVNYTSDKATIRDELKIPRSVRVLGYFTTSEYEIADWKDFQSPVSQLDLIDRLFDVFSRRDDCLVVRHHPYIAGDKTLHPDAGFLSKAYAQARRAPPNVRVIMPSEKLSSYALFSTLDACIAPLSTVSVETTARGIATATFEQSMYRQSVYRTIGDFSEAGLSALIDDLFDKSDRFEGGDLRRLYRFQSSLLTKLCVRFKAFGIRDTFEADIRVQSPTDFAEGADPALDRLCAALLYGTLPFETPGEERRLSSQEGEDFEIAEALKGIYERRVHMRNLRPSPAAPTSAPEVTVLVPAGGGLTADQSASLRTTRHSRIAIHEFASHHLSSLASVLDHRHSEFSAILGEHHSLDEHVLSTAVKKLQQNPLAAAVWFGAWLADDRGKIHGSIFCSRHPATRYDEAAALLPEISDWQRLLPFLVFRTEALRQVVRACARQDGESALTGRSLFEILTALSVERIEQPAMLVRVLPAHARSVPAH